MSQMTNPPVSNDFDLPDAPPAWPKVVGIISIVWASLGLVCGVCGLAGQAMQGAFVNMVPPEQQAQMKAQMAASSSPLVMLSYGLGMLMAILLLVAGIATVRRTAQGRMLHVAYGAISMLVVIFSIFVQMGVMNAQMAQMQSDPNAAAAAGAMKFGMYGGLAFGVCLGLAYPIFCLVWFGIMGKRPEAGALVEEPLV